MPLDMYMSQPNESIPPTDKSRSLKGETGVLKQKVDHVLVNELKTQWQYMWRESFNDKVKAESVSITDYPALHVEKGTIIQASRDFKTLDFKEILEQHKIENPDRFIPPDSNIGGWNKFIKTKITNNKSLKEKHTSTHVPAKPSNQQRKKGGRGWLHNV